MKNNEIDIEDLKDDLQATSDIAAVASMKGGIAIATNIKSDIANVLDRMLTNRATMTHTEYVAAASDIKSKLDLLKLLNRAEINKENLQQILDEITK